MPDLIKYEAARVALAEAVAVDEVKKIRDVSMAMKAYARQAKDRQMEIDASEIRIRAERRLGELIREQKATVGLATGGEHGGKHRLDGTRDEPSNPRPTLAEAGIDRNLSSRSQKFASIPEDEFEETLAQHREEQEAVTMRTMERLAKQGGEHSKDTTPGPMDADPQVRQFASLAISHLGRMNMDAGNAKRELIRVRNWIDSQLENMK